jgi:hypothetical protein
VAMSSFLRHIDASNNGHARRIDQPQMLLRASNFDRQPIVSNTRSCQGDAHLRRSGPVKYGRIEGHQRLRHKGMIQASKLHTKE